MDIKEIYRQLGKLSDQVNWRKQQKSVNEAPKVAVKPVAPVVVEEKTEEAVVIPTPVKPEEVSVVPTPAAPVEEPKVEEVKVEEPKKEEEVAPTPAVLPELPTQAEEKKVEPKVYKEVEIASMDTEEVIKLWESGNFVEENRAWIEREILRRTRKIVRKNKLHMPDGTCSGDNVKNFIALIRENS